MPHFPGFAPISGTGVVLNNFCQRRYIIVAALCFSTSRYVKNAHVAYYSLHTRSCDCEHVPWIGVLLSKFIIVSLVLDALLKVGNRRIHILLFRLSILLERILQRRLATVLVQLLERVSVNPASLLSSLKVPCVR